MISWNFLENSKLFILISLGFRRKEKVEILDSSTRRIPRETKGVLEFLEIKKGNPKVPLWYRPCRIFH
jgi:hypothetical protein